MHPDLTARVSDHSYERRLESQVPETIERVMYDSSGAVCPRGAHRGRRT